MRSQAERDQQTVTIATAVAIFAGGLLSVALLALLVSSIGDVELSGSAASLLTFGTVLLAGVAGVAYLLRHRRP